MDATSNCGCAGAAGVCRAIGATGASSAAARIRTFNGFMVVILVLGGALGARDDEDVHGTLSRIQFETELLLNGGEDRRAVRISRREAAGRDFLVEALRQLIRRPREREIVHTRQVSVIDHDAA